MWRKGWGQRYSFFAHVLGCFHRFQVCLGRFTYSGRHLDSCLCTEVELENTLRAMWFRKLEIKSLPMYVRISDLYLHCQLCKFTVCRTFEWTMGAPVTEMYLVLAAVVFLACTQWIGPGPGGSCLHRLQKGFNCVLIAILEADFGECSLVALWK